MHYIMLRMNGLKVRACFIFQWSSFEALLCLCLECKIMIVYSYLLRPLNESHWSNVSICKLWVSECESIARSENPITLLPFSWNIVWNFHKHCEEENITVSLIAWPHKLQRLGVCLISCIETKFGNISTFPKLARYLLKRNHRFWQKKRSWLNQILQRQAAAEN